MTPEPTDKAVRVNRLLALCRKDAGELRGLDGRTPHSEAKLIAVAAA